MIKGDYEWLKDLASRNLCAEHHTQLEVAWDGDKDTYYLRCGTCGPTDAITRFMSYTEEHKAGAELPSPLKENVEKGMRKREERKAGQVIPFELQGVPRTDLGTGELLLPEVIKGLVDYAHKYGLDPVRGHVCLMYGKPYITIDGYLFHANQTGVAYALRSRPLTEDERKTYRVGEEDHAWHAEVSLLGENYIFDGLGIVTYDEMTEESKKRPGKLASPVVAAHPWQLAQKRAEWQALRRAFPIGEQITKTTP